MKSKLLKYFKHLFSDVLLYGLSSMLAQLSALFLVPFYTKELSPNEYGLIGLFAMVTAFINPIFAMGLDSALFRYLGIEDSNKIKKELFSTAFFFKIIIVSFLILFLIPLENILFSYIFQTEVQKYLYVIFLSTLFIENVFSLAYVNLRINRKVKILLIINIFCLIWLVLILNLKVFGVLLSALIVTIFKSILYSFAIRKDISLNNIKLKKLKKLFRYGLPLVPHKIISAGLDLFVIFFINNQLGLAIAGIFIVAKKFTKPLSIIVSIVQTAWSPFKFDIHKKEKNPEKIFANLISFYWYLIIFLWTLISAVSLFIFKLIIDESYWDGIIFIPFIMLVPVFQAFKFTVVTGFELSNKQEQASYASFISGFFVIITLLISFNYFQPYNFILVQVFGYFIFGCYLYSKAKKILKINYPFFKIFLYFILAISVLFLAYFTKNMILTSFVIVLKLMIIIVSFKNSLKKT